VVVVGSSYWEPGYVVVVVVRGGGGGSSEVVVGAGAVVDDVTVEGDVATFVVDVDPIAE
jgi:hypothetical protein